MELNEYQTRGMTTCTESSRNFSYMMLNLVGEVGEFAGKVAKWIRRENVSIDENNVLAKSCWFTEKDETDLRKEAGDILWQLSGLCSVMGWSLDDIAQENLSKLADRQKRNVIVGDGDNR